MAFYVNKASQLERAVRAFLILQGKTSDSIAFSTNGDIFIANDSRARSVLPNRTCACPTFSPTKSYRPEGVCQLQILHKFAAVVQPDQPDIDTQRRAADEYLGQTIDTMMIGAGEQGMVRLAAAITAAGQWLAVPDGTTPGDKIASNNADMKNFRCDWIKQSSPFVTRGNADDSTNWAEILNFDAFVSHASISN